MNRFADGGAGDRVPDPHRPVIAAGGEQQLSTAVVPNVTDVTEEACPVMVRRLPSLRTEARCAR
jgi:hypothetical protein